MRRSFDRLAIQVAGTLAFFLPVSALAAPTLPLPPPKVGELVGAFELFRPKPDANLAAKQASAIADAMRLDVPCARAYVIDVNCLYVDTASYTSIDMSPRSPLPR